MLQPDVSPIAKAYRTWGRRLFAYAVVLCRRRALAEEAMQDLFARLAAAPALLAQAEDPAAYLFSSLRREALRVRDRERRWWRLPSQAPQAFLEGSADQGLSAEECREVEAAVSALPEAQREVVVLKLWSGLTFEQISSLCQVPSTTLQSRYQRALDALRPRLRSFHD